jgi:hypothetical protein
VRILLLQVLMRALMTLRMVMVVLMVLMVLVRLMALMTKIGKRRKTTLRMVTLCRKMKTQLPLCVVRMRRLTPAMWERSALLKQSLRRQTVPQPTGDGLRRPQAT